MLPETLTERLEAFKSEDGVYWRNNNTNKRIEEYIVDILETEVNDYEVGMNRIFECYNYICYSLAVAWSDASGRIALNTYTVYEARI